MTLKKSDERYNINRLLFSYNLAVNLFWTIAAVFPIAMFIGYYPPDITGSIIILVTSIMAYFLPNALLDKIKCGKTTKSYKNFGVLFLQKFTQNGHYVNKLIKKKFPDYRTLSHSKSSINKLVKQTYSFEKYHMMMFVIFGSIGIYALSRGLLWWALVIFMINLLYNIYPILLQHYIRLKLAAARSQITLHSKR
ncbi:MAG: hypothetical protein ACOH2A_13260 [Sphingobacteriaceae bacterium]